MNSRYRVCLKLENSECAIERLSGLCGKWRNIPPTDTKKLEIGHHWGDATQSVQSKLLDIHSGLVWGLRHRMIDREDGSLNWVTDICLSVESGVAWLSVGNHIETSEGAFPRPIIRSRTRPSVVPAAIREFGCKDPVGPSYRLLGSDRRSIRDFLTEIYLPQRSYPILFVSCLNVTDEPVTDVSQLADWLAGVASVVLARDRFPSRTLAEHLPKSLNCWDGAVRLYWPGLNAKDPPYMHRVFRPELVREHDDTKNGGAGFKNVLLGRICDLLAHHRQPRFIDWLTVQRLEAEQEMCGAVARAKAEGNQPELIKLFEEENHRLTRQVHDLTEDRDAQRERADKLEVESEYWRSQANPGADRDAESQVVTIDPQTVEEAIAWAEQHLSSQLVFALNSRSDRSTAYDRPSEVLKGLQWLATTYRDAKLGIRRCPNLDQSIKADCAASWFWKGGQSEITVSKHINWYECSYLGHRHQVREHIGSGVSKSPESTIRIAFAWLESDQKVLIGFIGQHQRTAAT